MSAGLFIYVEIFFSDCDGQRNGSSVRWVGVRANTSIHLSSLETKGGILITFMAVSFSPNSTKASCDPTGLRKTWPLGWAETENVCL